MKHSTDDDLRHINSRWLGPDGYDLPFQATYAVWGIGALVAVFMVAVERKVGLAVGPMFVLVLGVGVWGITKLITRHVNYERNFRHLVVTIWHEISAPRIPARITQTVSVARTRKEQA